MGATHEHTPAFGHPSQEGSGVDGNAVAITAVAGRFPGARNVEEFWANLRAGVESVHFFTDDELRAAGVSAKQLTDPHYVKARPRLADVERFDAAFFGIPPREAELMDPQHRLLLELAHEALERAGIAGEGFDGLVGVFAASAISTYFLHHLSGHPRADEAGGPAVAMANFADFLATRLSYKLNLRGPALTVQTACSSSLVAVHTAAQSLLNFECDAALAGGVNVTLPQESGYAYTEEGVMSPDGHCRPFDAQARGTVFGSGAGLVVLRRLADALRDGDPILAVLKGSAINNDGAIKAGFTAPAVSGQSEVIAEALANAGVSADDIDYVEAHGTATPLGDPIEVEALTQAFRETTSRVGFCALGSVKSNVGHLDAAAGVTGLIKTVLALQHGELPATLHFRAPNPRIEFASSPFFVNAALRPWLRVAGRPRRAGVSAFGVGGTNAHVILEEAPAETGDRRPQVGDGRSEFGVGRPESERGVEVLMVSARTAEALEVATRELGAAIADFGLGVADSEKGAALGSADLQSGICNSQLSAGSGGHTPAFGHPSQEGSKAGPVFGFRSPVLADLAWTLQIGRRHFEHRRAIVAADLAEARAALTSLDPARVVSAVVKPGTREVALLFPGQGAQSVGMGREVYAREPAFREAFDRCAELFRPALDGDLREVVYPANGDAAANEARLNAARWAQPALFAVEYALARWWLAAGVKPAALLGHSLGEVAAACVAGVFSIEDAVRFVAARARLLEGLPGGALLAVTLPPAELKRRLNAELSLAIVNGPTACVVAGATAPVAALEDALRSEGVPARRLPATHAFQSHLMEPLVAPLLGELRTMTLRAPTIPFISGGSGRWITAAEATSPEYWAQQGRRTVYFGDGLRELAKEPNRLLVEAGPGRILAGLLRPNLDPGDSRVVWASLPDARERKPELPTLLGTVARLWTAGVNVNWRALARGPRRKVPLPTYPFERQRFWLEPVPREQRSAGAGTELRREPLENWFYSPVWRGTAAVAAALPREKGEGRREKERSGGAWIVTLDARGFGAEVAALLREDGAAVIERAPGAEWGEAIAAVEGSGAALVGVVLGEFLSVKSAAGGEEAFHAGVALVQALVAAGVTSPVRIVVLTRAAQSVTGTEEVHAAAAMATGLAQVLPREMPGLDVRVVDLAAEEGHRGAAVLAACRAERAGTLTAWRGRQAWVPEFERVEISDTGALALRERGIYVITGGFGGIGLTLAEMLARRAKARLVLAGRRGAAGNEAAIARLEAAGAEVLAVAADVSTRDGIAAVLEAAERRWGGVHAIIHAAGMAGRTIVARKTRAEAETVFAAKVRGAEAISAACEGRALDFVVFCSSLAVWAGAAGQSDYVAANAFLDAQARALAARGVRAVAIEWDLWSGVGMGADEAKTAEFAITPAEGGEALLRALAVGWPVVAVSTADLPRRLAAQASATAQVDAVTSAKRYPRPALAVEYVEPAAGVEQRVAAVWQAVLGIDRVGAQDNFFELGGDSLSAMQALAKVKAELGAMVPVTTFYGAPTVRAFARTLGMKSEN